MLAYRARERLRQMYVRGGLAGRAGAKVAEHLAGCPGCRRLQGELAELNARVLPPGALATGVAGGT